MKWNSMLVKVCSCKCIKEAPLLSHHFVLPDYINEKEIRKRYQFLFDEHKTLLNMYDNAATAFDSIQDRLTLEEDCRIQFEEAFIELRDKYKN